MPVLERPNLFSLLRAKTVEERQKFGEARRKLKDQPGVVEELVEKDGRWKLVFTKLGKNVGELVL